MLTMVIVIIYNLADTFFVGQMHKKNLGIVFHTGIHAFILLILDIFQSFSSMLQ